MLHPGLPRPVTHDVRAEFVIARHHPDRLRRTPPTTTAPDVMRFDSTDLEPECPWVRADYRPSFHTDAHISY